MLAQPPPQPSGGSPRKLIRPGKCDPSISALLISRKSHPRPPNTTGALALDPQEPLLVVHCVVESTVTGSNGRSRIEEKAQQRAVRVPRMPACYDDCVAMAEELVVRSFFVWLKAKLDAGGPNISSHHPHPQRAHPSTWPGRSNRRWSSCSTSSTSAESSSTSGWRRCRRSV